MEVVIPFVALSGMYIISNRSNESFENNSNDKEEEDVPVALLKSSLEDQNEKKFVNNEYRDPNQTTDVFFEKQNTAIPSGFVSLSGNKLDNNDFQHNNMVPFFGAKIKGNYNDDGAREQVMDNMNGSGSQMKSKTETAPLFNPSENMNYSHGAPNMSDFYQSRVNPSMKMSNVKPWKEEQVAPGLNLGYTNDGSCGMNSALDQRETYMPKNVDDLRVLTNPKETYCLDGHEGPLSAPVKERGQFGAMEKHLPDRYYESGKDRWFTTKGIETKQAARSVYIEKPEENRETTAMEYEGVAKGEKHINYSKNTYAPSDRVELGEKQLNPASATDKNMAAPHDYGAKSYTHYKNNRNTTRRDLGFGIVGSTLGAVISPLIDVLRPSRKENVIGNVRIHGDVNPSHPKAYVNNQRDIRTTNRQMHPNSLNHYNIEKQGNGGYEVSEDHVVPTNRNETTTYYSGGVGGSGTNEGVATYDAAYNQTNNDMKEATTYNRVPQGNTQTFTQLSSERCITKQEKDRENNRMWVPNKNPVILSPSTQTSGLTNAPEQQQENTRLEPDLLDAFKNNPYTHSLNSVA